MYYQAKSLIGQEWAACGGGGLVVTVNRNDDFEIAECLLLQADKRLVNEVCAFVGWQTDSYARRWHGIS
jgi:hypothetical protein